MTHGCEGTMRHVPFDVPERQRAKKDAVEPVPIKHVVPSTKSNTHHSSSRHQTEHLSAWRPGSDRVLPPHKRSVYCVKGTFVNSWRCQARVWVAGVNEWDLPECGKHAEIIATGTLSKPGGPVLVWELEEAQGLSVRAVDPE